MAEFQSDQQVSTTSQVPAKRKGVNMWKYISIILILALIILIAFEFGKGQFTFPYNSKPTATVNMPAKITPTLPTASVSGTITPTPATGKTVSAGAKGAIFSQYKIIIPKGWTDTRTTNSTSDTLTVTNGQYVLTISQATGGAGSCLYPGDATQPMAQTFTNFVGITGTFSQFRRGTADNQAYTVCEQKSGGFVFPTSVGYITYAVPTQADQAMLAQMDGMVASLTK